MEPGILRNAHLGAVFGGDGLWVLEQDQEADSPLWSAARTREQVLIVTMC